MLVALALIPVLILADQWNSAEISDLRHDLPRFAALGIAALVATAALTVVFRRRPIFWRRAGSFDCSTRSWRDRRRKEFHAEDAEETASPRITALRAERSRVKSVARRSAWSAENPFYRRLRSMSRTPSMTRNNRG